MKDVLAQDQGTPKMIEIAKAIQEGASAYLSRQFKTIAVIVIPLAAIVFVTSTEIKKANGDVAMSFAASGHGADPRLRRSAASCPAWPATSA